MLRGDQIFFLGVISFLGGVLGGSFFVVPPSIFLLCAAIVIAVLVAFPKRQVLILGVCLICFSFGWMHVVLTTNHFRPERMMPGEFVGVTRIVADPEDKDFFQKIILRPETCESEYCPADDILWQAPRTFTAEAGTQVSFSCALEMPENFSPDFDYRMFLAKDGIGYMCKKASRSESISDTDINGYVRALLYRPKHAFEEALGRSISEPEAGLAKGLLLGGNDYLSESIQNAFTRIGLTHIVAVSGYNITLIMQAFMIIGIMIGLWRKQALWAACIGIVGFIMMIGTPASAVRAGVMAGIAFAALQSGRISRPVRVLFFAAALMLCTSPLLLRYDIGFQLSFLATLGIVIGSVWQEYFLQQEFFGKGFVEMMGMTLSAELFVLPIILYTFHAFSPVMFAANIIILPIVPYAMGVSFATGISFLLWPGMHIFFAWIAYCLLVVMTRFAEIVGEWSWVSVEVSSFGVFSLIVWYGALFFAIVHIERQRKRKWYAEAFSIPRHW